MDHPCFSLLMYIVKDNKPYWIIIDIALLSWMDCNGIILGRYAIAVASCYGLCVIILDEFNDFIE